MSAFIALVALILQHGGAAQRLDDAALRAAYADKTHISAYREDVPEYGGTYFVETYMSDGSLSYRAGGLDLVGAWRVENGIICFDYADTPLVPGCFVVIHEAGCYYSYQVDRTGRAIGLSEGDWWIRAYVEGTDPQCASAALVS
ncbi:MAG: hypothetical protein AAFW81_09045 [Pseudomonadota bacterium]